MAAKRPNACRTRLTACALPRRRHEQNPLPRGTRPIRLARRALRQAAARRHRARAGTRSTPSLWPAPQKNFAPAHWKYEQARGALDAAGRLINTELAERRNLILFNPASDDELRHRAHHGHRLSDDHAGRMGALAPPHAERAAPHPRLRARHLHRSRRRQDRHGAGRRAAHAELVEPRPRQRQPRLRLLARLSRRAAGAVAGADVLRAGERRTGRRGVRTARRRPRIRRSCSR